MSARDDYPYAESFAMWNRMCDKIDQLNADIAELTAANQKLRDALYGNDDRLLGVSGR